MLLKDDINLDIDLLGNRGYVVSQTTELTTSTFGFEVTFSCGALL